MAQYYDRHRAGNALFLHELATEWPGAARVAEPPVSVQVGFSSVAARSGPQRVIKVSADEQPRFAKSGKMVWDCRDGEKRKN